MRWGGTNIDAVFIQLATTATGDGNGESRWFDGIVCRWQLYLLRQQVLKMISGRNTFSCLVFGKQHGQNGSAVLKARGSHAIKVLQDSPPEGDELGKGGVTLLWLPRDDLEQFERICQLGPTGLEMCCKSRNYLERSLQESLREGVRGSETFIESTLGEHV